ncbi:MAG: DMT family transporter [Candidatus Thorarchaeota archaeon]|jgi:drug/metabolite transporter (DMT)-like permease
MSRLSLAYLALVATTFAWASSLILAKIVFTEDVGPIVFVALRYTIATPFLLIVTLQQRRRKTVDSVRKHWKILAIAGLSGPFISQIMQYIGLEMTAASDALLLINLTPIFAVILAAVILKEAITVDKAAGLVLATIGATLIVMNTTPDYVAFDLFRVLGDIIVIVSTLFFAINGIAGKIAVKSVDAVSTTFYSTLIAVPFIWISALILEDVTVLFRMSAIAWAIMLWVAIVNTVLGFILYYESMKYIEASRVQITLNLIGVWGVLMSVIVLQETVTLFQIIGGFLTMVGVVIAQMMSNNKRKDENHL